jgi:hypothetical protein
MRRLYGRGSAGEHEATVVVFRLSTNHERGETEVETIERTGGRGPRARLLLGDVGDAAGWHVIGGVEGGSGMPLPTACDSAPTSVRAATAR